MINMNMTEPTGLQALWAQARAATLASQPEEEAFDLNFAPCPNCPFVMGGNGEPEFTKCALCVVVSLAAAAD